MKPPTRERASHLFAALSHPTRLRILEHLNEGGRTVNEIASHLGIGQSGASQHLAILLRSGVLVVEPRGASRVYQLRGPRIGQILRLIEEFCEVHEFDGSLAVETTEPENVLDFTADVTIRTGLVEGTLRSSNGF